MPVTVEAKSEVKAIKMQREQAAHRVVKCFEANLPLSSRLLCFLNDDDAPELRREYGVAKRGGYVPLHDSTPLVNLPDYVRRCILFDDGRSIPPFPRIIDDLVYLYGSTCANDVGLTMTLAHELQHAVQHGKERKLWAVNSLIHIPKATVEELELEWPDIPTELDARIVGKRVALVLHDEELVNRYIDEKIAEAVEPHDIFDWRFVRKLRPSSSVDLVAETHRLFQRLRSHRREVEEALWSTRTAQILAILTWMNFSHPDEIKNRGPMYA